MRLTVNPTPSIAAATLDYESTMIGALELSSKKWVFAVQLPVSTAERIQATGAE